VRIISQDGNFDIPYEGVILQRFRNEIYVLNKNLLGLEHNLSNMCIAKYDNEEDAKTAMEEIREGYVTRKAIIILNKESE
jgi:hypothetical protein